MSAKIEVLPDGAVLRNGQNVGRIVDEGSMWKFEPIPKLHHATLKFVTEALQEHFAGQEPQGALEAGESHKLSQEGSIPSPATNDPEPPMCKMLGDRTPEFIEWYRRNHSPEEFRKRYSGRIEELQ